jgi:HEAT repeat protein
LDKRIQAAYELGNRKEAKAVPLLCDILENPGENINLRLNAVRSLGMICSDPCPAGVDIERVIAVLCASLRSEDEFLPDAAAEALERIGTPEALESLEQFRNPSADTSAAFLGEWELRDGENRLTVTFSADGEAVLDRWDAVAVRNHHLDSSWEQQGEKIIVNDLDDREWVFIFRQNRLFFIEDDVEKEMLKVSRKTDREG